jgi:hypothetical protein
VYRCLFLLAVLCLACGQSAKEGALTEIPFTLTHGSVNSDSAVFEQAGITAAFTNTRGMQVIHITRQGKRLINYIRAIDSGATVIPTPGLIIKGGDTSVAVKTGSRHFFFLIKNNRATYVKSPQKRG